MRLLITERVAHLLRAVLKRDNHDAGAAADRRAESARRLRQRAIHKIAQRLHCVLNDKIEELVVAL